MTNGDRIGCIIKINSEEKIVYFGGYGTVVGWGPPEPGIYISEDSKEDCASIGFPMKKCMLDNGRVVYSYEFSIRTIDNAKRELSDSKAIVYVDVNSYRPKPLPNLPILTNLGLVPADKRSKFLEASKDWYS
jgi:hypothetical protein